MESELGFAASLPNFLRMYEDPDGVLVYMAVSIVAIGTRLCTGIYGRQPCGKINDEMELTRQNEQEVRKRAQKRARCRLCVLAKHLEKRIVGSTCHDLSCKANETSKKEAFADDASALAFFLKLCLPVTFQRLFITHGDEWLLQHHVLPRSAVLGGVVVVFKARSSVNEIGCTIA
jgi:hypothetical protein